ncbi:MAG: hypothetical protein AAFX86_12485 [Pseudomonadota bacterium]
MVQLERNHAAEVQSLLQRNVEVVSSNCLSSGHPLLISGVGELAINLRECISIFEENYGIRCKANHDLGVSEASDVAHLVVKLRHSYVHTSTTKHKDMDDRDNRLS